MGRISEQTLLIEKHIAEQSLATTGHLPTGNELGGKFWDMVETHYKWAQSTNHVAWFDHNHCAFINRVEAGLVTNNNSQGKLPLLPTAPYVPPVEHFPMPPPVCTVPVLPPHYGHPGGPGGNAVPEPSSIMLALPMFAVLLVKWMARQEDA